MPEEQQRWYAIKIFERDDKVLAQLKLDGTVLGAYRKRHQGCREGTVTTTPSRIITNERYLYIASIIKGVLQEEKCRSVIHIR